MHRIESKFISKYPSGSLSASIDEGTRRKQEVIERVNLSKDRTKKNNIVINEITDKLKNILDQKNHPQIELTTYEKNPIPGQPDLKVTFTPTEVIDQNIFYTRSDKPENQEQSLKNKAFCIQTRLVIRNEKELLEENTYLTSKFW